MLLTEKNAFVKGINCCLFCAAVTNTDVEMEVSHEEERPKSALLVSTEHCDISL